MSGQLLVPVAVPSGSKPSTHLRRDCGGGGGQSRCGYFGQEIAFSSAGFRTQDRPGRTLAYSYYRGADESLARPGRKQATATENFEFHVSYL